MTVKNGGKISEISVDSPHTQGVKIFRCFEKKRRENNFWQKVADDAASTLWAKHFAETRTILQPF